MDWNGVIWCWLVLRSLFAVYDGGAWVGFLNGLMSRAMSQMPAAMGAKPVRKASSIMTVIIRMSVNWTITGWLVGAVHQLTRSIPAKAVVTTAMVERTAVRMVLSSTYIAEPIFLDWLERGYSARAELGCPAGPVSSIRTIGVGIQPVVVW